MSFNGYSQQQLDALSVGRTPSFFPVVFKYAPTANFINFPIGQFWVDTATQVLYYLESFTNSSGITQATWIPISASSVLITLSDTANTTVMPSSGASVPPNNIQLTSANSALTIVSDPGSNLITFTVTSSGSQTLTGNDAVAVSPSGGTIQTLGNTVSNSTYGQALWTTNPSGNIEQWNIQVAAAIGSGNVAKAGIAAFNSAQFTTNTTTGFVSLIGSSTSPPLIGLTPDATSGLGTSPVIADGSGNIKITSASISNTGSYSTGLQTLSNSVNQLAIQMQWAGSNAAVSTANNFGIAQFDSNMFTVSSGFVQIKNGGATGAVTKIQGDDSQAVVPASGLITFTGVVVNNGANAHGPVTFLKNNTSIEELDVQVASASGSSSKTNAGLASFNSAQFSVDANGYVSATGGGGGSLSTLTANSGSNPVSPMSGNINVYGVGSLTTVASANTVTTQFTGLTPNAVLVAGASGTAALINVGPNANVGWVLASTGSSTPPAFSSLGSLGATLSYTLDATLTTITPNGSGVIVLTGGQVASGTVGTNVIQTMGNAANSCAIQIQRSTNSPVSNGTLNGVSHYDSTSFNVDGNGYVTLVGSDIFTLSDDVNTQATPNAGNIQLTGHVNNAGGKFSTTVSGSHLIAINPMSVSRWIVDPLGFNGTHTTIASAIASASAGEDIFIMPGTYTQNLTLKANVNLVAWSGDAYGSHNVTIIGKCTFSGSGNVCLCGLTLQTNSDYAISVTGSSGSSVYLIGCIINATNNTALNNSSSSASAGILLRNCEGTLGANVAFFTNTSPSQISFINTYIGNSSASNTTPSTSSAGVIFYTNSGIGFCTTTSGSSFIQIYNTTFGIGGNLNATLLTHNGATTSGIKNSYIDSAGSASAISIGGSGTLFVVNTILGSNNANMITGTGTLYYANVVAVGSGSGLAAGLTKIALTKQN